MSNDIRNNNSLPYTSASGLKNEGRKHFIADENIIPKLLKEMIEIASENSDHLEPASCTADSLKKNDEKKLKKSGNDNTAGENDIPVRRSNRIRRSVVKKDEFISPRSKKSNKTKNNQTDNSVEPNKTDSNNNPNETLSKTFVDKSPPSRGQKMPKDEKKQKPLQCNTKRSIQSEKKKPARKKKCAKSEDISNNNTEEDSESKKFEKTNKSPEFQTVSDRKHSDADIYLECTKVKDNVSSKANEDPISETNDKSSESCNIKPVKVKSRWWRSSELEAVKNSESINTDNIIALCAVKIETSDSPLTATVQAEDPAILVKTELEDNSPIPSEKIKEEVPVEQKIEEKKHETIEDTKPPPYDHIEENIYRFERRKCKSKKQVRRMVCDCTLTKEEQEYGIMGCKEECLNRLLMIECGSRCPIGEACSNKKFQKKEYVKSEIFKTEMKGWGLRTLQDISAGDFLMEFVGEILNHREYRSRVKQYAKEKNVHSYFMALKPDEILDATHKGNHSRFINHSCNPNCETQKDCVDNWSFHHDVIYARSNQLCYCGNQLMKIKSQWTVNGELRVGVFAKRTIQVNEELTLDYQFQRYGREAQKCYCGADNCSGFIGGEKQISVDAYSGTKSLQPRKRKGSEDKKREFEDMILEQEIEKLNGNRGLRNRDDTLKLARLMVRADDSSTRHQLLDIILKTEEQACLRLFLDYHGLPLLWSWMTDVVEYDLKAKILQVLSLLPITNKTMLLDSKVMSIVEKWYVECSARSDIQNELCSEKSSPNIASDDTIDSGSKKFKITEFSDSETDSTSSHTVADTNNEASNAAEIHPKCNIAADGTLSEISKDNPDHESISSNQENPDNNLKQNIANVASGLLDNWKNLKEVFRIPRLEQQKRKEDEMEVDNNAKEKVIEETPVDSSPKCGDQIQVVISGKNIFTDHHRAFDYEQQEMKLDDSLRRYSYPRALPVLAKPRQINKPIRRHQYTKPLDKDVTQHKVKEDITKLSPEILPPIVSPAPQMIKPAIPPPNFAEPPPVTYPPPVNVSVPPPQTLETQSSLIYPHQMMYPPSQIPFMGPAPPMLPPNPVTIPPPTSVPAQPPLIQQPPLNTGLPPMNTGLPPMNTALPPCQPIPSSQPNVGAPPPNANNFLLPQNVPPTSIVPGTSQFIPSHTTPVQSFPPGPNVFTNQSQPVYFMPPPTSLPNNPPPSFSENQNSTFPIQPVVPIKEEPSKPIRLPKNWRTATDAEGNVYYYHSITRHTQWDPPSEEDESDDDDEDSNSEESESSDTPTYDEPKIVSSKYSRKKSKKRKPTKAAADTSVAPVRPEIAKKIKELFRTKMSSFIVCCLNTYRKPSCTTGRITSNEDFKYLARKLTHYTMTKELKQCKNVEDLDCNETVMHKAKDFIKKYMSKYGPQYVRKEKGSPAD